MQYVLTEDEMNGLVKRERLDKAVWQHEQAIDWFIVHCVGKNCIHDPGFEGIGYCDEKCPIGRLGPRDQTDMLCKRHKKWGK